MVEHKLDRVFGALSDPTRRALLDRLASGERTVTDLARPWRMSLNAVSKHLKVLEGAGLVSRRIAGREHHLSLRSNALGHAAEWLRYHQQFWTRSLDQLAQLAESGTTPSRRGTNASRSATRPRRGR
jgi:DNA-binding transcriptional ArsR family regulator